MKIVLALTHRCKFRQSVRLVSSDVNTLDFYQLWLAVDWKRRLDDPEYLAFLAGLYLLALAGDEASRAMRARRYLWDD